jgi:acyl-CoA synthetase (AMP-forming)/AMP-acid ligase II
VSNKDVIVKGGENVFPQEIEGGIEEMEGIVEPAVIGGPTDIGAKESLRWS